MFSPLCRLASPGVPERYVYSPTAAAIVLMKNVRLRAGVIVGLILPVPSPLSMIRYSPPCMNADKLFSFAYVYLCVFSHLFSSICDPIQPQSFWRHFCVRITHAKITVVFGFSVHIPRYKSFGEGQGIPDQSSRLLY